MEQLGNLNLVDVDARVPRLRAAHHEQPTAERRARHAGQVLHHLERVVVGAGHHAELRLREPHLRHLAAVLHATHDRLVRARLAQHVRHLGALARLHVFGLGEGLEARGGDAHAHGPGRNVHHLEAARVVGERLFVTDEHRPAATTGSRVPAVFNRPTKFTTGTPASCTTGASTTCCCTVKFEVN